MGLRPGTSNKLPGGADVAGVRAMLCVTRAQTRCEARRVGRVKAESFWSASHRWQPTMWAYRILIDGGDKNVCFGIF